MRGNAMSLSDEASSVTMLRVNNGYRPEAPTDTKTETTSSGQPVRDNIPENTKTTAQPGTNDLTSSGKSSLDSLVYYGKRAGLLLAGIAVLGVIAGKSGITIPFIGQAPANTVVAVSSLGGQNNSLVPPSFGNQNAKQLSSSAIREETGGKEKQQGGTTAGQSSPSAEVKPELNSSEHNETNTVLGVLPQDDRHITYRLNQSEAHSDQQQIANDKLFIEMHRQLDTLSDQVKELQNRLETTKQALNDRVSAGLGKIDGRIDELQHREDLIETQHKTEQTSQVQSQAIKPPVANQPKADPASTPPKEEKHVAKKAVKEPAAAPLPHYSVQAGAPDVAILMDSSGSPIRVQPGSTLDGWGNVLSVVQSGNNWVVKTEHGTIR